MDFFTHETREAFLVHIWRFLFHWLIPVNKNVVSMFPHSKEKIFIFFYLWIMPTANVLHFSVASCRGNFWLKLFMCTIMLCLVLYAAEEKIIRATAASKGFNCVDDYAFHILRQNPNWCGILYNKYARTYRCERQNSSRRTEHQLFLDKKFYGTHCELYRNFLVSDCNAAFDGKSLQFPDESHLTQKTYLSYKEQREIAATTLGMTVKEYEDFCNRTIVDRCKVLLRNLGEWARDFWS